MTYQQLRAALSAYMHRADPETIGNEPTALELARLKVGRIFHPELSHTSAPLVFIDRGDGTADVSLPLDFGQAETLYASGRGDLEWLSSREFARRWADGLILDGYTIEGTRARGAAVLATLTCVLSYYRAPSVIAAAEENWCSVNFPDVWLWLAIAEQHRYVQDAESAALADRYALELADQAETQTRANVEGGALRMHSR